MLRNLIIAGTLLFTTAASSQGAIISWSAATNVDAASDVSTQGTLVRALNLGSGSAQIINGVTFAAHNTVAGGASGTYDVSTGVGPWGEAVFTGYGTPLNNANAALPADYGAALSDGTYVNGSSSTRTQTLSGLTNGQAYLIQVWFNDVRTTIVGDAVNVNVFDSGVATPSVTLRSDDDGLDGAGGRGALAQFATGLFTANAITQIVRWDENAGVGGATINMFQIRAVPEPSSLAMMLFGMLGLWLMGHKRFV